MTHFAQKNQFHKFYLKKKKSLCFTSFFNTIRVIRCDGPHKYSTTLQCENKAKATFWVQELFEFQCCLFPSCMFKIMQSNSAGRTLIIQVPFNVGKILNNILYVRLKGTISGLNTYFYALLPTSVPVISWLAEKKHQWGHYHMSWILLLVILYHLPANQVLALKIGH